MEFHLCTLGLISSKSPGKPMQSSGCFFAHPIFSLAILCPANPNSVQGVCCTPHPYPAAREVPQAHSLDFLSLKVQNPVLPVIQCLTTLVSYLFSSLCLDYGGGANPVQVLPPGRRSPCNDLSGAHSVLAPGGRRGAAVPGVSPRSAGSPSVRRS